MNITFNEDDEEVDGMMQWHGTSGSSEDFTGTDYDQVCTHIDILAPGY